MNKLIKIYLVIVTALLLIGIGLGVYVWYMLQNINSAAQGVDTPGEATETPPAIVLDEPVVIEASKLPEAQRKALETVGLGNETFTITQNMVTCAEGAIGSARVEEILNGAAPSPLESMKLLPCMKK